MEERLNAFLDYLIKNKKVYNATDFSSRVGKSKSQMSEMLGGKRKITNKTASLIKEAFPELNTAWLIDGTGDMLLPEQHSSVSGGISQQNVNGDNNVTTTNSDDVRLYKALYSQKCEENAELNLRVAKLLNRLMEHGIDIKGC